MTDLSSYSPEQNQLSKDGRPPPVPRVLEKSAKFGI